MVRTSDPLGREGVGGLIYRDHYIFDTLNVENVMTELKKIPKSLGFDPNTFVTLDVVMGKNGYIYGNIFIFDTYLGPNIIVSQ